MSMSVTRTNQSVNQIGYQNEQQKISEKLASGKKVNKASDDAANMAIIEKLTSAITDHNGRANNYADLQNAYNVADGALSTINDGLLKMRDLKVQSENGIYTDDQKKMLNYEMGQLKEGISESFQTADFNTQQLFSGSFDSISAMSASSIGIDGDVSLDTIDQAIDSVNSARASLGAKYNSAQHSSEYETLASLNLQISKSRIADTDLAKAATQKNAEDVKQTYQLNMQKNEMQNKGNVLQMLL